MQHIDLGLYLIRKRQQQLEEVEISDWTTTDVFFMVCDAGCIGPKLFSFLIDLLVSYIL